MQVHAGAESTAKSTAELISTAEIISTVELISTAELISLLHESIFFNFLPRKKSPTLILFPEMGAIPLAHAMQLHPSQQTVQVLGIFFLTRN